MTTPIQGLLAALHAKGCNPRQSGAGQWSARCPAHHDRNPSLSITEADDGHVLVHCHAACGQDDVVGALGLTMADLFARHNGHGKPQIDATYDYTDEAGKLLFQVVRFVPKGFRQRRPDGRGGWVWNLDGIKRTLYRLPDVLAAYAEGRRIFVAEGEKDVDAIRRAGETATCNPGGVGKWKAEYTEMLSGHPDVVVVADVDEPGIAHAADVARKLRAAGCGVELMRPAKGKDVAQMLGMGFGLDELVPLTVADEARTTDDESDGEEARWLRLTPASSVPMDRPQWVWEKRIPVGGTTLMAGREGFGKTALVCWLAARLSRGDLAGQWHGRPADVIYVGLEDDRATVTVPRLVAAGADLDRFLFVDIPSGGTFSVGVDVGALLNEAQSRDVALVVLDPLDSHLGNVDSHRKSEVQAAVAQLARLAQELRCGALGLGHLNKSAVRDLLTKVVGSVGFTTSVRSLLGIGEHPQNPDEKVCVLGKANMTDRTGVPAIRFRTEEAFVDHPDGGEPISTARVVILGEEDNIDPDSILPGGAEDRSQAEEAVDWLHGVLSDGPTAKKDVGSFARAEGISDKALRTARERLGVVVERDEKAHGRPSTWTLPLTCPLVTCPDPGAHKGHVSDQGKHPDSYGYVPISDNGHVTPTRRPGQVVHIPRGGLRAIATTECRLCATSCVSADDVGPIHPLCADELMGAG